jgi:hypothetical protein
MKKTTVSGLFHSNQKSPSAFSHQSELGGYLVFSSLEKSGQSMLLMSRV